ncbi:hypothetical protein Tco_0026048 [Tanacetum coccineum]
MYHKKNVDYAYLLWEDFVYQVENKNVKKSNEMLSLGMKINIRFLVPFCPDDLTMKRIKELESYKEYYAIALGAEPPKTKASVKKKQSVDKGTGVTPGVPDVPKYGSDDEQISWKSSSDEMRITKVMVMHQLIQTMTGDGLSFFPKISTHDEENIEEDSFDPRVQTPSHVKSTDDEDSVKKIQDANVEGDKMNEEDTNEERRKGQQQSSSVSSGFVSNMLNPSPNIAVSLIPGIIDAYLANKMHKSVKTDVHLQSERLGDEAQAKNILPKIEKTVNEQLKTEVLTRLSNESKTSHVVAANLSQLELNKILIDKMESNKSIYISDEQKNLYKELVDAYESNKPILDTYGDTVSFKRHRDDEDKDEEPSARSNRGSKRRRAGKEPESTSAPKEKTSKTIVKSN